jgi:hypothetical protein
LSILSCSITCSESVQVCNARAHSAASTTSGHESFVAEGSASSASCGSSGGRTRDWSHALYRLLRSSLLNKTKRERI